MRPFTKTMLAAAAAAAALAAGAVVALPAIGDSGTTGTEQGPDVSGLAACLAKHGLSGAPTAGRELKPWLAGKDPDAVGAAMAACKDKVPEDSAPGPDAAGPDAATVIACVRSQGVDAPTAPADFKRWLGQQQQAGGSKALDHALVACKIAPASQDKARKPDCGTPTDKQPAAKPERPGDTNTK